ncbi:MAG: (3R)-hydroxyacyl-ACP dehydratase subunit HadA [Mycobacterium sp.]
MALSERIVGAHYRYPDHYHVDREKIREYARAIKAADPANLDNRAAAKLGHSGLVAPLTFISTFGYAAQRAFFADANIVITDAKIVQVDQALEFRRPIVEDDKLYCDVYGESLRQAHGTDIIVIKTIITNEAGDIVQQTHTTLAGRTGDGEEGFTDGTA